tara:strand:- start:21359 stop:21532 length:174 start_codon:yes stop_codon:yes gene_type:complete
MTIENLNLSDDYITDDKVERIIILLDQYNNINEEDKYFLNSSLNLNRLNNSPSIKYN